MSKMREAAASLDMRGSSSRPVRVMTVITLVSVPNAGPGYLQVVGADHVHLLFLQLGPAVFHHVPGLHGEAAQYLSRPAVLPQVL